MNEVLKKLRLESIICMLAIFFAGVLIGLGLWSATACAAAFLIVMGIDVVALTCIFAANVF